jgi:hypothetical protein
MNKSKAGQQKGKEKYKKVRNDAEFMLKTFRFSQNHTTNLSIKA